MKSVDDTLNSQGHRITLPGGHSAVIRPIQPDDGPRLAKGLRQLSPESQRRRFLFSKTRFSAKELTYFTHCDGAQHLALVVAIGPKGQEQQFVAVARCIRESTDGLLAEVAIAVADDWQHHGVGEMLIQALARSAWEAGIRYWNAILFTNNFAMRKLLTLVGQKQSEESEGAGVVGLIYKLCPPSIALMDHRDLAVDSLPKG
jgi:acetyltransferase